MDFLKALMGVVILIFAVIDWFVKQVAPYIIVGWYFWGM